MRILISSTGWKPRKLTLASLTPGARPKRMRSAESRAARPSAQIPRRGSADPSRSASAAARKRPQPASTPCAKRACSGRARRGARRADTEQKPQAAQQQQGGQQHLVAAEAPPPQDEVSGGEAGEHERRAEEERTAELCGGAHDHPRLELWH